MPEDLAQQKLMEHIARSVERLAMVMELRELTLIPAGHFTPEMERRWKFIMRHLGWGSGPNP